MCSGSDEVRAIGVTRGKWQLLAWIDSENENSELWCLLCCSSESELATAIRRRPQSRAKIFIKITINNQLSSYRNIPAEATSSNISSSAFSAMSTQTDIVFYGDKTAHAPKVAIALEELKLNYKKVRLSIDAKENKSPEFRKVSSEYLEAVSHNSVKV